MRKYRTDDGHVLDYEDFTTFAKWKAKDLLFEGYSVQEIIEFERSKAWSDFMKKHFKTKIKRYEQKC